VIDPAGAFPVGSNETVTVTVTNTLAPGSVTIEKTAPASEQTTLFNFTITCTNPDNVYHVHVTGTDSVTQPGIPAGSSCTVTEDNPGSTFNPPVIDPAGAFPVGANETVTVTVSNTLAPGSVTITKVAPALQQDQVFHFSLDCTNPTQHYDLQVTGSHSVTQGNIPAGSICQVTETGLPDVNNAPTIDPAGEFTVGATKNVAVTVTNTLKPLGILIVKSVTPTSGAPGDTVTYSYKVTNTGEVTLFNIKVTDDKLGLIGTIPSLAPGASTTLTKTTTLPNAAGNLVNVGTATGTDVLGRTATSHDTATVTVVLGLTILPKTGSSGHGSTALVGFLFIAVGVAMATRKERGRVRPAFATSSSAAGRAVMLAANRRSWRMRRRRGPTTRARLRWRRSQGPPMRDGP
jgi:LPXTG-motif cell wall-anchored protein